MSLINRSTLRKAAYLVAGLVLFSCNSNREEQADASLQTDTTSQASKGASKVSYMLPSPLQIASIFKKSGLKYIEGISNPITNSTKYTTGISKNLNLGVYSSDLCYSVVNNQTQASINYLKTVKQLVDQLGMASVFETNNVSSRFENNLSNEDSLAFIISEMQLETDMFLEENEKKYMSAIVFAGAWIESMYIGSQVYQKTKMGPLSSKISEQMSILENTIKVLKNHETTESQYTSLVTDLESIQSSYASFESVKKHAEMKDKEENPKEISFSEEEIKTLSKQIADLRTKIVNA